MLFIYMSLSKIRKIIRESLDELLSEDYPSSFDMEEFKKLTSFAARIRYCEEHLQRISSGSSRIVYKIDDEKVLKLAKNKKGLAQNEIEVIYGQSYDLESTVAHVFEHDENYLWVEMELARKVRKNDFKRITGFYWDDYVMAINNYGEEVHSRGGQSYKMPLDKEVYDAMWEDEFVYDIFGFIGNYHIPVGDLKRLSSYGIVKREGKDEIVLIDYGLTTDVYDSYYS